MDREKEKATTGSGYGRSGIAFSGDESSSKEPRHGGMVMEGADFPPFSPIIQQEFNLPVFDIVTLTNMVYQAVVRKGCDEIMPHERAGPRTNCLDTFLNSYDADSDSRNSFLRRMLKREYIDHEGRRRRS